MFSNLLPRKEPQGTASESRASDTYLSQAFGGTQQPEGQADPEDYGFWSRTPEDVVRDELLVNETFRKAMETGVRRVLRMSGRKPKTRGELAQLAEQGGAEAMLLAAARKLVGTRRTVSNALAWYALQEHVDWSSIFVLVGAAVIESRKRTRKNPAKQKQTQSRTRSNRTSSANIATPDEAIREIYADDARYSEVMQALVAERINERFGTGEVGDDELLVLAHDAEDDLRKATVDYLDASPNARQGGGRTELVLNSAHKGPDYVALFMDVANDVLEDDLSI